MDAPAPPNSFKNGYREAQSLSGAKFAGAIRRWKLGRFGVRNTTGARVAVGHPRDLIPAARVEKVGSGGWVLAVAAPQKLCQKALRNSGTEPGLMNLPVEFVPESMVSSAGASGSTSAPPWE